MEYLKKEIMRMLKYSLMAYQINLYNKDEMFNYYSSESGVQFCYKITNDELIVSFRGTDSMRDVASDLKFWKKVIPYDNEKTKIKVHAGFLNAYKTKDVRNQIQGFMTNKIKNVIITGHSYGAALAVLCAIDLEYNFPDKNIMVVVFGCPRMGNSAFEKSYDRRVPNTFRVENSNDLITKIPFGFLGYSHIGKLIHIGSPNINFILSFDDHQICEYIRNLWNAKELYSKSTLYLHF